MRGAKPLLCAHRALTKRVAALFVRANGSVLNATEVADYFESQAWPPEADSGIAGRALDECLPSNENVKGEADAAAVGFRNARRRNPNAYIAAWGGQAGDMRFASLMADGTFSLAMIEAYSCKGDVYLFKFIHAHKVSSRCL